MLRPERKTFALPGGCAVADGACHRDARLRALTGYDEEWAASLPASTPQAMFVTGLLSRVLLGVGPLPGSRSLVRSLLVGDREYLLLQLGQISIGSNIDMILPCPREDCRTEMEVAVAIDSIPVKRCDSRMCYELAGTNIVFRLPQGVDEEEAAHWESINAETALRRMLARCVVAPGEAHTLLEDPEIRQRLAAEIERLSPQLDCEIQASCPKCGETFVTQLDPVAWIAAELSRGQSAYERDLHLLGFHYHWPLRELLSLSREQRGRYVSMLQRELQQQRQFATD